MCWIACLATVETFMRMDCPLWNKVDPNTNCLSIRFQGDRQLHASKEHPIFSMSSATFQLSAVENSTLQKLPLQFSVFISATMALMRHEIKAAMRFCFRMFIFVRCSPERLFFRLLSRSVVITGAIVPSRLLQDPKLILSPSPCGQSFGAVCIAKQHTKRHVQSTLGSAYCPKACARHAKTYVQPLRELLLPQLPPKRRRSKMKARMARSRATKK